MQLIQTTNPSRLSNLGLCREMVVENFNYSLQCFVCTSEAQYKLHQPMCVCVCVTHVLAVRRVT